jgi:dihydropteroate synthase
LLPSDLPAASRVYLQPVGVRSAEDVAERLERGEAMLLAGGPLAFADVALTARLPDGGLVRARASLNEARDWAAYQPEALAARADALLDALGARRASIAGLTFERPLVMGIINVTPDSFADGGLHFEPAAAIRHGHRLIEEGVDILDIGGESTRPGAAPVDEAEERRRILSVIGGLAGSAVPLSIDTRRASIMTDALQAGARIINDVSALTFDRRSVEVAATSGAAVILMHSQGDPKTMQQAPSYDDPLLDVFDYLAERVAACAAAGLPLERLIVDPGIGFGKTVAHNVEILRGLSLYHGIGTPLLVGASRKSFIARLSHGEPESGRLPGSLAAALAAVSAGAQIVRVHDVGETRQALAVARAVAALENSE